MMEEKGDHISRLPDEILQRIISLVSFKEAVQSSALSLSWRSLMSPFRVDIDRDSNSIRRQLLLAIESLSESDHHAGFQTLKLYLGSSSHVPFAVCTKGVHGELHLDFSEHKKHSLSSSSSSSSSSSTSTLRCFSLIVDQSRFLDRRRPSFARVKNLHLRSISHLVGDVVSDLCSSCPVLESLKIEKCSGLEGVDVKSSTTLKNFEMADCPDIVRIALSAQNLTSFSYKGVLPLVQLLNVPNLVDVTLNFGDGLGNYTFECEDALSLLSSVKDIEILKINSWLIETLCCAGVIFSMLDFKFSRLKKLEVICSKTSSQTRDSFACFLHITPSLEELLLKMEQSWKSAECPMTHQHWHEPHLWNDYATVKSDGCRLKHLKKIRMMGFAMEEDHELLWMDLLLHNAINLKEMILDDSWRVAKVPYSHLHYIKLKNLLIPCPKIDSYFVLIEDSRKNICD